MKVIRCLSVVVGCALLFAVPSFTQVTNGKKPNLPAPFETKSAGNGPDKDKPPAGFLPKVPSGFQVGVYASDFSNPRFLAVAPNGDIFVAETGAGKIIVLRDPQHGGGTPQKEVFAEKLNRPFGIAFHDDYVYVGNTGEVVRFKYDKQTSKRTGEAEHILDVPKGGGHFTRTLAFSQDGTKLYISVGSSSNLEFEKDARRAAVLVSDPDGKNSRIFASGLRNAVGLAIEPVTGEVWVTVNERDELGDNLPPDYFTSRQGWWILRLAVQLHRRQRRPAREAATARLGGQGHHPGRFAGAACGAAAICVLHRQAISRAVSRGSVHCRARFLESRHAQWLPGGICWRSKMAKPRRILMSIPDGICARSEGQRRKWPPCRCGRSAGWFLDGQRRWSRRDLSHQLREIIERGHGRGRPGGTVRFGGFRLPFRSRSAEL